MENEVWKILIKIGEKTKCFYRIKIQENNTITDWDKPLFEPSPSYIELKKYGPINKSNIEWVEINPILISEKQNHQDFRLLIFSILLEKGIQFDFLDNVIRINVKD